MKVYNNNLTKLAILSICLSGVLGGGYFWMASALMSVILFAVCGYQLYKEKTIMIAADINLAAMLMIVGGYFISACWAIDYGMALVGAVKFLPLFLFFVFICQIEEKKEELIQILPMFGTLMTLFSFIMMQFPVFEKWVSVAGRLAGFFQYPNTYALFMLICFIIVFYRIILTKLDWLDLVHIVASVFGIMKSGSRTVFVLTIVTFLFFVISQKAYRKKLIYILIVATISFVIFGSITGIYERITSISFASSTFLGRLLYVQDALPLILKHPLGLGYYGYYFGQQEIQTGVYSVVSVHNEFLQFMLDIGIIPAIVFYGAILKSVFSKHSNERNKLVLIIMLLHSLFDYDFQFLVMGFVLILFLNFEHMKKIKIPALTKVVCTVFAAAAIVLSVCVGVSEFYYMSDECDKSLVWYRGNTMAKIGLLSEAETIEDLEAAADDILANNKSVSIAYSAKARINLADGDIDEFVKNKIRAINLAPYQYEEYVEYLEIMAYCTSKYVQEGDMESAEFCVKRAENIPGMLESVKDKTSWLGWKINDLPQVVLSHENLELISAMRESISE